MNLRLDNNTQECVCYNNEHSSIDSISNWPSPCTKEKEKRKGQKERERTETEDAQERSGRTMI